MYSHRRAALKINTRLFSIIACSGLASTALAVSAPVPPWTTYQGNALHTGYVPITLNPARFTPLWNVTIGSSGAALHQVTEADGLVFLTQNGYFSDQGLYVLAAKNGASIWSVAFPGIFSVNPPAYDDANVYIQTVDNGGDTWVRGYVAASGTPIFQSAADAQWENYLAPTIVDHTLYMDGGTYGGMYSFNGVTGAQNWFAPLAQFDEWTPAVDAKYAYSYLGGDLTAVSRSTGLASFSISDPNFVWDGWSMFEAPTVGSLDDVVVTNGGRLLSFDLAKQTIRWVQTDGFNGQASIANGIIYVVNNNTLSARDESTGNQLWLWSPASDQLAGPIAVTATHAFISGVATTYAISLATHLPVWSYPNGGALTISDGQLFIAGATGQLSDISLGTVGIGGAGADVDETLTYTASSPTPPESFKMTATTVNNGPEEATNLILKIPVPSSFGVESPPSACSFQHQELVCQYASLGAKAKIVTHFTLVPSKAGTFDVAATVTATQTDPVPANNKSVDKLVVP